MGDFRGGVEARSFYLAKYLVTRGHTVTVLASREPGQPQKGKVVGATVIRCGPPHPFTQGGAIGPRIGFVSEAVKIGTKIDADVVDGHSFLGYLPAWHIARKKGVPAVATYHDVWLGEWVKNVGVFNGILGEIWERYVLSRPWDHFIANSKTTRKELLERAGISPKKVTVVPNGIEWIKYQQISAKKYTRTTIVYAGRLVAYKNVDVLLRAAAIVRQKIPDLQVKIIGSGPERENLERLTYSLGIADIVRFLGFVRSHVDVLKTIKKSHVFCSPSSIEGFGMTVLEAAALGVPYVASDIPPIREATGGRGGTLIWPNNPRSLAEAIYATIVRDDRLPTARDWVKKFDWKELAAAVEKTYSSL